MMKISAFKNLVNERAGLVFDNIREDLLSRELVERMSSMGLKSHEELFHLLTSNNDEFLDFVKNLTINETYFFREPKYFELLTERLVPEIQKVKGVLSKVRVLSAGCSTGEEPYSIAMALKTKYGKHIGHLFSIVGIDIDHDALRNARKGFYGKMSFRGVDNSLKSKYFDEDASGRLRVKAHLKDIVEFYHHNLMSESYPDFVTGADIIFYRNVSIYFDPETQKKVFNKLIGALNDYGYIVLASAETFAHNVNIIPIVEKDGLYVFRKIPPGTSPKHNEPSSKRTAQAKGTAPKISLGELSEQLKSSHGMQEAEEQPDAQATALAGNHDPRFLEAFDLYKRKSYEDALKLADNLAGNGGVSAWAYMLRGITLLKLNRLEEAEEACFKAVEIDELALEAYLILAIVARQMEDPAKAFKMLQKALYVNPFCWMAHYYTGDIYESRGEKEKARRHYQALLNVLGREDPTDLNLIFFPISLQQENLVHFCRNKIKTLKGKTDGV